MKKKIYAGFFALLTMMTMFGSTGFAAENQHASANENSVLEMEDEIDLKDDRIYFKQSMRGRCTLAANVMMIRRAKILMGDEDWEAATESTVGAVSWRNGMAWNFTYDDVTVSYQAGYQSTEDLKALLKEHPEGVVIYDTSIPHAICLTDYDEEEDTFYCADSATGFPEGRISTDEALIHMNNIRAIWYVASTTKVMNIKPVRVPVEAQA